VGQYTRFLASAARWTYGVLVRAPTPGLRRRHRGAPWAALWLCLAASASCKGDQPVTAELGGACQNSSQCATLCLVAPVWPSGFCTRPCHADADCPTSAVCVATPTDGAVCLFACLDNRDCAFLDGTMSGSWGCVDFSSKLACGRRASEDAGMAR
jgi:hypothetical protein